MRESMLCVPLRDISSVRLIGFYSHPAIATVARFGALATAAVVGMQMDQAAYPAIILSGLCAIALS